MSAPLLRSSVLLAVAVGVAGCFASDPAPGIWRSKEESRNLECVRVNQRQAHDRYPGDVPEVPGRRTTGTTDALICSTRFVRQTFRPARDEVILSTLRQSVGEIVSAANALAPAPTVWHVDAFYPDAAVASKISVAARMDLAERGRKVSDRVPVLAAGDIAVLAHLEAREAYPLACLRYFRSGVLHEHDAFLGLMIIDDREAQLHAGLCQRGEWKWLQ